MKKLLILIVFFVYFLQTGIFADNLKQIEYSQSILPEIESEALLYFSKLQTYSRVYQSDLVKVIMIIVGLDRIYTDSQSQLDFIRQENLLPKSITDNFDPERPLRKGLLAYAMCKILDINGGLCMRLFGINQRYAFKELVYKNIISPGNVSDLVTGEMLVSVVQKSCNYKLNK